ncbi:hypothetical protein [Nocardia mexicana]|uniref:hypothetical protein n=1 Tax=Nocardia mexicana TaxID=279262 RepID=UPI0020D27BD4|nr:hypothetical protein [Nocardia mexicana]
MESIDQLPEQVQGCRGECRHDGVGFRDTLQRHVGGDDSPLQLPEFLRDIRVHLGGGSRMLRCHNGFDRDAGIVDRLV